MCMSLQLYSSELTVLMSVCEVESSPADGEYLYVQQCSLTV